MDRTGLAAAQADAAALAQTVQGAESPAAWPHSTTLSYQSGELRHQTRRLARFAVASVPGAERQALEQVARGVAGLGLPPERLDRLKAAVAEATMNAIEHGSHGRPGVPVDIEVAQQGEEVVVTVSDQGGRGRPGDGAEVPDLDKKLAGEQGPRGWGLFLIRHLVDADVISGPGRHTVRLAVPARAEAERG